MKKLIAVTASLMLATGVISVNAADIRNSEISISDIIESVNEKSGESKCKLLSGLFDCLKDDSCSLPNIEQGSLNDILDYFVNLLPQGKPDDTQKPENDKPEVEETPDVEEKPDVDETPDVEMPETEVPDNQKPDTEIPETPKPDTDVPGNNNNNQDGGYESTNGYVNEVLSLVNKYRNQNGLASVTLDSSLCKAADIRAKEIKSSFSHTRPNGSSCFTVLSELGISYGGAGENIAYGQSTPEEVMTAWMNSDGHRANILGSSFTKLGVGVYSSGGTLYWAQMFAY